MLGIRAGRERFRNMFDVKIVQLMEALGFRVGPEIWDRVGRQLWSRGWQGVRPAPKYL